ncbi:MAG: helix-turn-helix transcriptional regulator [Eubacteriales bacterium]|nr:helix-turn-helix transcriptional regulator [Eubacteriales bacterium]
MNSVDKKRYIQIGLKIAYYRKLNGFTQEELAEKINRSTGFVGQVEAPNIVTPISLNTLFSIADVFQIQPYKLLEFDDVK